MAKYEVTAPSGERFEISAPDNASESEVMSYAQAQFKQQAAPKPVTGSLVDQIPRDSGINAPPIRQTVPAAPNTTTTGRYMLNQAAKVPGAMASLPLLPLDFAAAAANDLGILPQRLPQPGSMVRDSITKMFGIPNYAPADSMQQFAGHMAQTVVGGLPFSARAIALAPNPLPAAATEVANTISGGVGSFLGGEVSEAAGLGRAPGQVLGGMAGQMGGTVAAPLAERAIDYGTNLVKRVYSPEARQAEVGRLAGKTLGKSLAATPTAEAELARTGAAEQRFRDIGAGDARLTLGQRTGAKGVLETENALMRAGPLELERGTQQAQQAGAVVERGIGTMFKGDANITRIADSTLRRTSDALDNQIAAIEARQQQIVQNPANAQMVGESLTKMRDSLEATAKATNRKNYGAVYEAAAAAPAVNARVAGDLDEIGNAVRQTVGADRNAYTPLPPIFQKVAFRTSDPAANATGRSIDPELMAAAQRKPPTFEELHSLMKEANREFYAAERAGRTDLMGMLNGLRGQLTDAVKKYEGAEFGDVAAKLRDANNFYANTYRRAFREGVGGKMDATGRYGEVLRREQVADRFLTPTGVDDFYAIFGGDRQAHGMLQDSIVTKFQSKAMQDGLIDPKKAQAFIAENRDMLAKVPDVQRLLTDRAALNEALAAKASRLRESQKSLDSTVLAKIAKADDPQALMTGALTDQRTMMAMIAQARDVRSRGALGRLVADAIPEAASRAGVTPFDFMMQNRASLQPAISRLGPDHWKNLEDIATMQTAIGRSQVPQHAAVPKGGDPFMEASGSTARTWNTEIRATTQGRQGTGNAVLHLLSRFGIKKGEEAVAKAQAEAIYNPELAAAMVQAARKETPKAYNDLRNALLASGIRIYASTDTERQEQPVAQQLMDAPKLKYGTR